jgi:hypothetical protein
MMKLCGLFFFTFFEFVFFFFLYFFLCTLNLFLFSSSLTPSVTWLDNYSHIYHKTAVRANQADFRAQLWTAEAQCIFTNSAVQLDFAIRVSGNDIVSIMPNDVFSYEDLAHAMNIATSSVSAFKYETTLCLKWKIRTSPPIPDLRKLDPQQRKVALSQSQFMGRFVPVALHDYNIGSNPGLSKCMRELHNKVNTAPHNLRYHAILADVSIFERVLKVCVV